MRRAKVKNRRKAAKKFNRSVHKTKKVNMHSPVMRGGIRF